MLGGIICLALHVFVRNYLDITLAFLGTPEFVTYKTFWERTAYLIVAV